MAIEVAFLTVILRKAATGDRHEAVFPILQALFNWAPDWLREDPHLVATSFMCPRDVRAFGTALEARTGLQRDRDWAVADMLVGVLGEVSWLEFRGGPGEATGAWLAGTEPGELARVRSLVPGQDLPPERKIRVMNAFGRDSRDDAAEHRQDFGTVIPAWGGKDVWYLSMEDQPVSRETNWMIFDAALVDFMSCGG